MSWDYNPWKRSAIGFGDHYAKLRSSSFTPARLARSCQQALIVEARFAAEMGDVAGALEATRAAKGFTDHFNEVETPSLLAATVHTPAEFARLMKGEWSVGSRQFLLPMLLDAEDPKLPPDPGELLDAYSLNFLEIARVHEAADIKDLPSLEIPSIPDIKSISVPRR